jgi:hypothetical protein
MVNDSEQAAQLVSCFRDGQLLYNTILNVLLCEPEPEPDMTGKLKRRFGPIRPKHLKHKMARSQKRFETESVSKRFIRNPYTARVTLPERIHIVQA